MCFLMAYPNHITQQHPLQRASPFKNKKGSNNTHTVTLKLLLAHTKYKTIDL